VTNARSLRAAPTVRPLSLPGRGRSAAFRSRSSRTDWMTCASVWGSAARRFTAVTAALCAPLRPFAPLPLAAAQTEARKRKVPVKHLRRVAAPHLFRTGLSRPLAYGSKLQCRDARTGARIGSVILNPQRIECRRRSIDVVADLPPCLAAMEAALRNSAA